MPKILSIPEEMIVWYINAWATKIAVNVPLHFLADLVLHLPHPVGKEKIKASYT